MTRRAGFILSMALLLGLGLLASYLLGKLEAYEDEVEHGPAPEVASSPYLAAEHFLRRQGIAARRADGLEVLDGLPSQGQTLMLLAVEAGLATCAQEFWARYPKTVGQFLGLPEDHMLFSGMALGYADEAAPINGLRTRRDPFDVWAQMRGFD